MPWTRARRSDEPPSPSGKLADVPRLHLRADEDPGWIADGERRVTVAEAVVMHGEDDAATVVGTTRLALDALPEAERGKLRAELLHAERLIAGTASSELTTIHARLERIAGMCPPTPDLLGELAASRRHVAELVERWREHVEQEASANALLATVQPAGDR